MPAFGLMHHQSQVVDLGSGTVVARPTRISNRRRVMVHSTDEPMQVAVRPTRGSETRRLVPRALVMPCAVAQLPSAVAQWRRHAVADGQRVVVPAIAQWRSHVAASLCYARVAASTGLVWFVHAIAAPLHKQLGCSHFAAASLDHCIQLSRLFLGLARRQKAARTCLRRL